MMTSPLSFDKSALFAINNFPKKLAETPKIMNTVVKPNIKPRVCMTARFLFFNTSSESNAPVRYMIYAGTNGNRQGERNERIPAEKAVQ